MRAVSVSSLVYAVPIHTLQRVKYNAKDPTQAQVKTETRTITTSAKKQDKWEKEFVSFRQQNALTSAFAF